MVRKAHRLAQGSRDGDCDGLESPAKAEPKLPPGLVQKRFPEQSGGTDVWNATWKMANRLLWEPGAGGWRPGGSGTAGKAQG